MKDIDLKIGLAFSGGGFRASAFSLGVLTYLNRIKIGDEALLKKVIVLSTISGGTITGARYATGIKNGESLEDIYKKIYHFMSEVNLINLGLDNLISKKWGNKRIMSLINAISDVYDSELFDKMKFGTLFTDDPPIHLKHISFNATEFANGLPFRFQRSEKINAPEHGESDRGIVGNYEYRIPENIAREIRMADILASSSCFPGGFEPINFPTDFKFEIKEEFEEYFNNSDFPVGLMDGGIVDNQGIEPLLLAEERLKRNRKDESSKVSTSNVLDLLIISDVASPYMDDYKASKQQKENWWRKLTPQNIFLINFLFLISSIIAMCFSIKNSNILLSALFSSLITLNIIVFVLGKFIKSIPKNFQVPNIFMKPLKKLMRLKLIVYENLIMNRANSLLKMTNDVFLKHVRRLNFSRIYEDDSWKNRRIMNAIYELRNEEKKLNKRIQDKKIDEKLIPSKSIRDLASKAAGMGTTLWFTDDELEKEDMLNSIIACGQFNICWNLLEYIETLKKDPENTNESHNELIACEDQLLDHWKQFKAEPLWMVNEINAELKI